MKRALFLTVLLLATPLLGQVRPEPGAGDRRLQTVRYDPEQVVRLEVASGYELMVSFAGGERVETIAIGDSASWQATPTKRGDVLFLKNLRAGADTNMTVVTDARTYMFELGAGLGGEPTFAVKFIYPEMASPAVAVATPAYVYRLKGARAIRPSAVTQQGNSLIVIWPAGAALPAIFKIDEDGPETLVNGEMRDGHYLIEGTPKRLIFRLDRQVAIAERRLPPGARQ